ncbi:MAG: sulfatase-like hydrolase/transferase, partial [Planctomycetota bacterium]
YDEYLPERKGLARAEVAEAFLRGTPAEPFFLDVGFGETHRTPESADGGVWHNGQDSPAGDPRYVQPPPVLPDRPEIRLDFADYAVAVERLDRYYGLILDRLERTGLAERTIVLVTTDHGIAFPGMKCNLTDHGLGVLAMLRGPEDLGLRGGRVVDAVVSQTDLLPTLCDWLGLACPSGVTGRSWRPILDGTLDPAVPDSLHDAVFGEVTYHGVAQVERSVRTPRFKYIRRYGAGFVRHSCDPGISRETAEGWGWMDRGLADEQLYDLLADPQEANNLADRPGFEREVTGLRTRLESWMQSTADPALSDEIPAQPARF